MKLREITISDLPAIARVHRRAFSDAALTSLGDEAVRRYYQWQLTGPHRVVALAAEVDGSLVGFCFGGRFNGALSGFVRTNRRYLALLVLTRPWLLRHEIFRDRIARAVEILGRRRRATQERVAHAVSPEASGFGILAIAVDPAHNGSGVGRALMQAMDGVARSWGCSRMRLTVSPANLRAVRFYEKLGWSREMPDDAWAGAMTKRLAMAPPA